MGIEVEIVERNPQEAGFVPRVARAAVPSLDRLVVAVDPAVTTTDTADLTAFTVAGRSYPLEQM
ncbi:hypothetical protein [Streptomyces barringtoniae]|uniref:hypothetical protein n=1 Tax=Streptomyces barringtoniae TaxID=2892029 RepID=UPI001E4C5A6D|nr:hypothetical protein [Streptomyces barringtoniae]MCC5481057.1 hypothetical protein [Streptomyces barringtoniae]